MTLFFLMTTLFMYLVGGYLFQRVAFRTSEYLDQDGVYMVRENLPPLKIHVLLWFLFVPYWELTGQTIQDADKDE